MLAKGMAALAVLVMGLGCLAAADKAPAKGDVTLTEATAPDRAVRVVLHGSPTG